MERFSTVYLTLVMCIAVCCGGSLASIQTETRCGSWMPVNYDKCITVAEGSGLETYENAAMACKNYGNDSVLLTIKNQEEQRIVQEFLFHRQNVLDNVWLGLKENKNSSKFEWNDETEVKFSNWANQSISEGDHRCVEMASGKGFLAEGLWDKVHCQKRLVVVCEKPQTLTLEALKDMFVTHKVEIQKQRNEFESLITNLEETNAAAQQRINVLEQKNTETQASLAEIKDRMENEIGVGNSNTLVIPVGFIYFQLPGQSPPSLLWPQRNWTDISNTYAGLFFRVLGGNSSPFGEVQDGDSFRLEGVRTGFNADMDGTTTIPSNGSWSGYVYTGHSSGAESFISLSFRSSNEEVRPQNQAIRVWKCAS